MAARATAVATDAATSHDDGSCAGAAVAVAARVVVGVGVAGQTAMPGAANDLRTLSNGDGASGAAGGGGDAR